MFLPTDIHLNACSKTSFLPVIEKGLDIPSIVSWGKKNIKIFTWLSTKYFRCMCLINSESNCSYACISLIKMLKLWDKKQHTLFHCSSANKTVWEKERQKKKSRHFLIMSTLLQRSIGALICSPVVELPACVWRPWGRQLWPSQLPYALHLWSIHIPHISICWTEK